MPFYKTHSLFRNAWMLAALALFAFGEAATTCAADDEDRQRITDRKKGQSAGQKIVRLPLRIATLPLWVIDRGIYYGTLTIDEKSLIQRSAHTRARLAEKGFVPQIGGAGDGAGFGVGLAWRLFKAPVTPTLHVAGSIAGYQDHRFELDFSPALGERIGLRADVRYRSQPEEDFFGIGPTSREADRTSYDREQISSTINLEIPVAGGLTFGAVTHYANNNIFDGKDEEFPTTQELFDPASAPGLGGAELLSAHVAASFDRRDYPGDATSGGLISVSVGLTEDLEGSAFDHWSYAGEIQAYLPLLGRGNRFGPRSVLAIRVHGEFAEGRSGGTTPFFAMPYAGGSSSLRGFREFRFRDRGAVVANFEYRWQIQTLLQAVLFADQGQVVSDIGDLDFNDFKESYGGGIRIGLNHVTFFRVEIARSTEQTRVFTKFAVAF